MSLPTQIQENGIPCQVIATEEALNLLTKLTKEYGEILMYQSGGCCDGSTPYCYQKNDFKIGNNDKLLGYLNNVPFYIHQAQFAYWKHTQLIIHAESGNGSEFSLEYGMGEKFVLQSRIFTEHELQLLKNSGKLE